MLVLTAKISSCIPALNVLRSMQVVVRIRPPLLRELQGTSLRPYQVRKGGHQRVLKCTSSVKDVINKS